MLIHRMPVQSLVLRSVHDNIAARGFHRLPCRHRVQLALRFRCRRHRFCTGSPDPRRHFFRSRQPPVSGQLSGTVGGVADHPVPVSCCLSATGIRFSGHPIPAEGFRLPHGRPTGPTIRPGPRRGYHVPHDRDATGVGAPSTPGTAVLSRRSDLLHRRLPLPNGQSLHPAGTSHRRSPQ